MPRTIAFALASLGLLACQSPAAKAPVGVWEGDDVRPSTEVLDVAEARTGVGPKVRPGEPFTIGPDQEELEAAAQSDGAGTAGGGIVVVHGEDGSGPAPGATPASPGGSTTNIVIVTAPPAPATQPVYIYSGGYFPGSYPGQSVSPTTGGTWGSDGFGGPSRTARPGQTPSVGGNWPSVPSYGPATMK